MPNGLPALALADFPLTDSEGADTAAMATFMDEQVKPTMAELLDQEPFPQGDFGCFSCQKEE